MHRPQGSLKSTTSSKSPTPAYRTRRSVLRRQARGGDARKCAKFVIVGCVAGDTHCADRGAVVTDHDHAARCRHDAVWRNRSKRSDEARSEEHTSELQSLMRISYDVLCLKNKNNHTHTIEEGLNERPQIE